MVFPPGNIQIVHPDTVEDDDEADVEDEEDDDGDHQGTEEDWGHPDSPGDYAYTDQEKQTRAVSDVDFQ